MWVPSHFQWNSTVYYNSHIYTCLQKSSLVTNQMLPQTLRVQFDQIKQTEHLHTRWPLLVTSLLQRDYIKNRNLFRENIIHVHIIWYATLLENKVWQNSFPSKFKWPMIYGSKHMTMTMAQLINNGLNVCKKRKIPCHTSFFIATLASLIFWLTSHKSHDRGKNVYALVGFPDFEDKVIYITIWPGSR